MLFQISFRPQLEIETKLGMGGQSIVGPLSQDYGIAYMGVSGPSLFTESTDSMIIMCTFLFVNLLIANAGKFNLQL